MSQRKRNTMTAKATRTLTTSPMIVRMKGRYFKKFIAARHSDHDCFHDENQAFILIVDSDAFLASTRTSPTVLRPFSTTRIQSLRACIADEACSPLGFIRLLVCWQWAQRANWLRAVAKRITCQWVRPFCLQSLTLLMEGLRYSQLDRMSYVHAWTADDKLRANDEHTYLDGIVQPWARSHDQKASFGRASISVVSAITVCVDPTVKS